MIRNGLRVLAGAALIAALVVLGCAAFAAEESATFAQGPISIDDLDHGV